MPSAQGFGQLTPEDLSSPFNVTSFIIRQALANVRTVQLVSVKSSTSNGQIAPPGTVNVQPLVNMLDGQGNSQSHGTVYNIPIWRFGSGLGQIIADPQAGDIGIIAVIDRDISSVKNTNGQQSNPSSLRQFSLSDGVYLGTLFGKAPKQYIVFTSTGISIVDINNNSFGSGPAGWAMSGNVTLGSAAKPIVFTVNGVPMTIP